MATIDRDAARCDVCGKYLCHNPLSEVVFKNYGYARDISYCIHCAAESGARDSRWITPYELYGGEPSEWPNDVELDSAKLFLAYHAAAFWSKVWTKRASNLDDSKGRVSGAKGPSESATSDLLWSVNNALGNENSVVAMKLLLRIGSTDPTEYEESGVRLLAFHADNILALSAAWQKLLSKFTDALPDELAKIMGIISLTTQSEGAATWPPPDFRRL